ncbi:hypothetical protein ACFSJY_05785 [Thalassotalea euphylliae]|uniref:hypothetical protein n=1 Tax=Thalassotalea euphylliae TaxID=1655234 RepID=UPI00363E04E7
MQHRRTFIVGFIVALASFFAFAMPQIKTEFGRTLEGFVRIKVINETPKELACYVAIDGRKIKFRLPALAHSKWYKATDKRYTVKSFSTWCDYIEFHPEYRKYVY